MFHNKKFGFYTVVLCLTGLVYTFLCAGLEGGQLELLRAGQPGGWTAEQVSLPLTVGAFLAVPAAFLALSGCLRHSVRRCLILWGAAAALGCIGLMNAQDIYWLFFASVAVLRCACAVLQIAVAALGAAWFIRRRGRVLGLVTLGTPLFSAIGAPVIGNLVAARLAGDWRPLYLAAAAALALLALAARFLLRDRPEDAGLYPDGAGRAPAAEPEDDPAPLTVGRVLKTKRAWLVLAVYGAYIAVAAGCMGAMEVRFLALGGRDVWTAAAPWLALGAILGMPASYAFGWLNDRLGAPRASLILGAGLLIAPAALWAMPQGGNALLEIIWGLGVAVILGGVPTLLPCAAAHAFGRRQYLAAARVLLPVLLLAAAAAPLAAVRLIWAGYAGGVCAVLTALAALGAICAVLLGLIKTPAGPADKGP